MWWQCDVKVKFYCVVWASFHLEQENSCLGSVGCWLLGDHSSGGGGGVTKIIGPTSQVLIGSVCGQDSGLL